MRLRSVLPWLLGMVVVGGAVPGRASLDARGSVDRSEGRGPREASLAPIGLGALPLALHRRAARYFESMRRTSDSPWHTAHLVDRATPILRPGVTGAAYFEVPVAGPEGEPRGYLLVSNGEHDFPVAGATKGGEPASAALVAMAHAEGEVVARVWMPSLFAFVAENARGDVVAQIGALPPKVDGLDRAALDRAPRERWGRAVSAPGEPPRVELPTALGGLRYGSWSSWAEYRAARDGADALDVEVMRRTSAPAWEEEARLAGEYEGLDRLEVRRVPLLTRGGATFTLRGPGAARVVAERGDDADGYAWVNLHAASEPERETAEVTLDIAYGSGEREVLGFAIAPRVLGGPSLAPPLTTPTARTPVRPVALAFPTCRRVALQTWVMRFVGAIDGGGAGLLTDSWTAGPWETFDVERQSDGTIALRSGPTGYYVAAGATDAAPMTVSSTAVGARERFSAIPSDRGTFALRAASGKYVSQEVRDASRVTTKATTIGKDEQFTVLCDPPAPTSTFPWARDEVEAWSKQRKYNQVDGSKGPNRSACVSGCGATAWAMLIGHADFAAANGHPRFGGLTRFYTADGGRGRSAREAVAPEFQDRGIDNITVELRDAMGDWGLSGCTVTGSRFTSPVLMAQANQYFWGRVPARVIAEFDAGGIGTAAGAANVVASLRAGHVTAIGTGHLAHYPVAFGMHAFSPRRWVASTKRWTEPDRTARTVLEVNWGWGHSASRSVPLHSWFKGIVDATPYTRVDAVARDCSLRAQSGALAANTRMDRDYRCRTHFESGERHVAFEVAERLVQRELMASATARRLKVCMLKSTDIQCAPCNTTDRLIVRVTTVNANASCPADTVHEMQ